MQVFCDLGTDCSDCGSWTHLQRKGEEIATPVAALSAMEIDVYSKETRTLPSFIMPFTNPKHDVDVSGQMHVNGNIEIGLTQVDTPSLQLLCQRCGLIDCFLGAVRCIIPCAERSRISNISMQVWYTILHGQCVSSLTSSKAATAQSRLVLDVGSNFGYYSLYAAAHGCRWAIRGIRPSSMHISTFQ